MLSRMVLSLFFNALFNCLVPSFIFMGSHSILLFVMFVIMISIVQSIDTSTTVYLENIAVMTMIQDTSAVNFVILVMDLIYTFMWVISSVVFVKMWIMPVVVLVIVETVVSNIMIEWLVVFFIKVMRIIVILVNSIELLGYCSSESFIWKVMMRRTMVIVLLIGSVLNSDWKVNIVDCSMLWSCSVVGFCMVMTVDEMISVFIVYLVVRMSKVRVVMISELVLDGCMCFFIIDMMGIEVVYTHIRVMHLVLLMRSIELIV